LPFVSRKFLSSGATNVAAIGELGIVAQAMKRGSGLKVLAILPKGAPEGSELRANDVITAVNGKQMRTVDDLRTSYAAIESNGGVEIGSERDGRKQTTKFSRPATSGTAKAAVHQLSDPKGKSVADKRALSHEAGHIFFIAWVNRLLGTPLAEDGANREPSDRA